VGRIILPDIFFFSPLDDPMNPFDTLLVAVHEALGRLAQKGVLPADLPYERITVEPPRERGHGDAATNAALILAKPARLKPLAIAEALAGELAAEVVPGRAEAVPPGFVNMSFTDAFVQAQVPVVLAAGADYGRSAAGGASGSMSSSARPTRPGRCMSGTGGGRCSAMRWRSSWRLPGSLSPASTTSTMPGRRSRYWRGRSTIATSRHWGMIRGRCRRGSIR
jgi:hypothetical protein